MLDILQFWIKLILIFMLKLGIIFMIACTVFVIVSFIRGDIRININIVKSKTEEKND